MKLALGLAAFLLAAGSGCASVGTRAHLAGGAQPAGQAPGESPSSATESPSSATESPSRATPSVRDARAGDAPSVTVAGASVSAGFTLGGAGASVPLAHVIAASFHGAPVQDLSSTLAFATPERTLRQGVRAAAERRADLLVALDGLFWFAYGAGDDAARERRFERGLEILSAFEGEVLVGDLPDFRAAGVDPLYLPRSAIPSSAALARMNARLAAWAAGRPHAIVVPLARTLERVLAGEELEVLGNRIGPGARARLFQRDGLHATRAGACVLWLVAADAWLARKVRNVAIELDLADLVAELARPAGR